MICILLDLELKCVFKRYSKYNSKYHIRITKKKILFKSLKFNLR